MRNNNFERQRGSALLYSVLLMSVLIIVAQLCFSLIIFAIKSRRQSYNSQVNYWLAWGGAEAAITRMREYQDLSQTAKTTAWRIWPSSLEGAFGSNLIDQPLYMQLDLAKNSNLDPYQFWYSGIDSSAYLNIVSATYFVDQDSSSRVTAISLKADESAVFDLSKFNRSSIQFEFSPIATSQNSIVWFRAYDTWIKKTLEGVIKYDPASNILILPGFADQNYGVVEGGIFYRPSVYFPDPGPHNLALTSLSCDASKKCNFTVSTSTFWNSYFQFLKIKTFQGNLKIKNVSFGLANSQLGLPYTIIHSIGYHGKDPITNQTAQQELYVKFPNALQSIPDVLDYSLYQADF